MNRLLIFTFFLIFSSSLFAQKNTINNDFNINSIPTNNLELELKNKLIKELENIDRSERDNLKIGFVSPIEDLRHENSYTFTIAVVYNLVTTEEGILNIGYNNATKPNSHRLITEVSKVINKGKGYHIFNITAKVYDLHKIGKAFYIATNLSEYPHAQAWRPLASDRFILKVN